MSGLGSRNHHGARESNNFALFTNSDKIQGVDVRLRN